MLCTNIGTHLMLANVVELDDNRAMATDAILIPRLGVTVERKFVD